MTDPQNNLTPQAPAPQPSSPRLATPTPQPALLETSQIPACQETLDSGPGALLPSAPSQQSLCATDRSAESPLLDLQFATAPLQSLQTRPAAKPRNGKIAHLPKLERDMVNRMLANNLPHAKIVAALDECGFQVTERNVSNWKTHGGYKEWCAAQAQALELHTFQDNLTEFIRRHDAAELPEVGLQSAATNLSAILCHPDLMRQLISEPEKYSKLIEIQCRLAREIQALQKSRDDAAKQFGYKYNPERLKRQNEQDVEQIREVMSSKTGKSSREAYIPHRNLSARNSNPSRQTPNPLIWPRFSSSKPPWPLRSPFALPSPPQTRMTSGLS